MVEVSSSPFGSGIDNPGGRPGIWDVITMDKPLNGAPVRTGAHPAPGRESLLNKITELQTEIGQLQEAIVSHTVIDHIRTAPEEALVTARSSGPGTGPTEEITARRRDGAWRREYSRSRVLGLLLRRHPAAFATALVSLVRAVGTAALRPGLPRLQFAALLWRAAALLAASLFRLLWIGHVRTPR